jgi:hypothetical protein
LPRLPVRVRTQTGRFAPRNDLKVNFSKIFLFYRYRQVYNKTLGNVQPHYVTPAAFMEVFGLNLLSKGIYQNPAGYLFRMEKKAKTFYIKPLKLFSHQNTVYLHAQISKYLVSERKPLFLSFRP